MKRNFEEQKMQLAYLQGYQNGYKDGVQEGYGIGVEDTINQIKKEAHEKFTKDHKNYGMNFIKHLKSKYKI